MAKSANTAKNAASGAAPENDMDADDSELESAADGEDEEEDLSLPVDPTARGEDDTADEADGEPAARALTPASAAGVTIRPGSGGIYVPAILMRNPVTRWLAEAYIELRKVTWPETREAWNMSLIVVAVSVVMAGFLAAADFGLGHLLSYFVSLGLGK